ncbi:tRNA (adenosine(37)-N6)-dimethylallyltransferase MiaA [Marivirga aurantiaca]|uniref:tRNA (adenosine(37)-N6)-dimethylallyltransferase MiaA n=1 Tax=Marivirga aurantiaca TaxID=2802615 RepID=UPI00293D58D1|nr:tRNA (adenosine(37)-N6)-dimethylallyltransferase MiaA [Marivirga aurantiaca]
MVLAGPTAVGKTALSVRLAKYFKSVILSADSRQFYKETNVGTAKPTLEEMQNIPHYFINSLSIHEDYNVGKFEKDSLNLLQELFDKLDTVIVAGGSGLYIKALCEGIDDMPSIPTEIRESLNQTFKEKGIGFLQEQLQLTDPAYFKIVDQNNPQRLIRALELYEATGKKMSFYRAQSSEIVRPFDIIKIGLERPREELYERINARMDQMIDEGLFEEAEKLLPFKHLNALQTVGYSEIFGYLQGEYDREEAVRLLKRNSRRYAKRQLTWFKKDQDFKWFNPGSEAEIIETIESIVNCHN